MNIKTISKWLLVVLIVAVVDFIVLRFTVFRYIEPDARKATISRMNRIEEKLNEFQSKCGRYPSAEEGLEILDSSKKSSCSAYVGTDNFFDKYANDVWKNPIIYKLNSDGFLLISAGNECIQLKNGGHATVEKERP